MELKGIIEEKWAELRNTVKGQHEKLEETQKTIESRINELRYEWRTTLSKEFDHVFCATMEAIEKAFSHVAKEGQKAGILDLGADDRHAATCRDWIQ